MVQGLKKKCYRAEYPQNVARHIKSVSVKWRTIIIVCWGSLGHALPGNAGNLEPLKLGMRRRLVIAISLAFTMALPYQYKFVLADKKHFKIIVQYSS